MKGKKILSLLLAVFVFFTMSTVAFAGGPDSGVVYAGGVLPENPLTTAQQIQKIKNEESYSEIQKEVLISELMEHATYQNNVVPMASTSAFTLNNFPYYYQEDSYWCVPACVKMTIKYTTGTTLKQSDIAEALKVNNSSGIPLSEAVPYLNNNQKHAGYTQIWPDSVSQMQNDFYNIMYKEDAPAIISTKFSTNEGYPYDMLDVYHGLCVTGQTANGASFRLHDPIYNPQVAESYYITANNIMVRLSNYIA